MANARCEAWDDDERAFEALRARCSELERRAMTIANDAMSTTTTVDEARMGDARACLRDARAIVEEMREIMRDAHDGERKLKMSHAVTERSEALENTRGILRHAALERAAMERKRIDEERDALLLGSGTSEMDRIKASGAMAISSEATEGLRRARQMMATELEKGEKTLAALEESTATMERTGVEYSNQHAKLKSGRRLITTIERQTIMDKVILWFGFSMFLLVVIHILWKRTPLIARFHPLYRSKVKALESVTEVVVDSNSKLVEEIPLEALEAAKKMSPNPEIAFEGEDDPYAVRVDPAAREEL